MISIPNIFHFILISKDGIILPEMKYYHYVAIKSAYVHNRPQLIYLYISKGMAYPTGEWWSKLMDEVEVIEVVEVDSYDTYLGKKINYFTHKTDIIRMEKLYEFGGIYLDLDVITLKSYQELRHSDYVCALEDDSWRLGSAVLMSKPRNPYLAQCLLEYQNYRSTGRDEYFVEMAQEIPYEIWKSQYRMNNKFSVLNADQLLAPKTLTDFKGRAIYFMKFFEMDEFDLDDRYCVHLWTELNGDKIESLFDLFAGDQTTYSKIIKQYID